MDKNDSRTIMKYGLKLFKELLISKFKYNLSPILMIWYFNVFMTALNIMLMKNIYEKVTIIELSEFISYLSKNYLKKVIIVLYLILFSFYLVIIRFALSNRKQNLLN